MDLNLTVSRVTVEGANYNKVDVLVEGVDDEDVLNHFSIDEVIRHFSEGEILNKIGEETAIKHFGIEVN